MKKHKIDINAWEPAIWGAIFGSSTVTTLDIFTNSDITPDWFKTMLLAMSATVAVGSAYEMYQSIKEQNKQIQNLTKQTKNTKQH